jgi:hypothetical protein
MIIQHAHREYIIAACCLLDELKKVVKNKLS